MIKRLTKLAIIASFILFASNSFAQVNVTFQVDMGIYMQLTTGGFNPATDSVYVRGDWQTMAGDSVNWAWDMWKLSPSNTNDSIYTITVPFPDSAKTKTINYKFVILNAANPENTGGNGGMWENVSNRTYTITSDTNQIIPSVYFNDKTSVGITVSVTFQANMADLLNQGFNPGTDSIEVRGDTSPLNWGPGILMAQSLADPNIFEVTVQFTGVPGASIQWKFHCDPQNSFSNTGWENITDNRVLILPHADSTISPVTPVITVAGQTTAADTITFHVDMNGAHEAVHQTLITGLKSVWIGGSVAPLQWPASSWLFSDTASGGLIKMYDDGDAAHGDVTAGDGIYSNVLIFPTNSATPVYFKYGAVFNGVDTLNNGVSYLDNEAGFGENHTLNLNLGGGSMTQDNQFGDQVTGIVQEKTGSRPTSYALSQNYPNPFNPTTKITYEIPKAGLVTLKIYNVLGQEVATLIDGFQNSGKYTASFNALNLSSGVYFYRIKAGNFSLTKKMLLLK